MTYRRLGRRESFCLSPDILLSESCMKRFSLSSKVGSAAGGVTGKLLFDLLGGHTLGLFQSLFLCLIIAGLLLYLKVKKRLKARDLRRGAHCLLLGFVLGLVSAFLGIGGGPLNLAALTYFLNMDNKKAALYSIYIILFSQTASLLLTMIRGNVPIFHMSLLVCVICGGIGGGFAGSAIGKRLSQQAVGGFYAGLLVIVLVITLENFVSYL